VEQRKLFKEGEKMKRFVDGEPLRSKVAVVKGKGYEDANEMVRKAIELIGGIKKICGKNDIVMIKPNMVFPRPPELNETTHPAIVEAVVRICKETGATVKVGEQSAWHFDSEEAFRVTGIKDAALRGGADEVVNWEEEWNRNEYINIKIPNGRSITSAMLPKSLMESTVIIHIPKMKMNYMQLVSLSIKGWLGILSKTHRGPYHRTNMDMAWATCDLAKAVKDKHKLTLIDGIIGMQGGGPHAGLPMRLGAIVASSDMVAADAVACYLMGLHPLEAPSTQIAMKEGIGTGELSEMELMGEDIDKVRQSFIRPIRRYVSKWKNVIEYSGGACEGCLFGFSRAPIIVDPQKTYALIAGGRAYIPDNLRVDEAWLIGTCACSTSHQLKGFKEKLKNVKKIVKIPGCPGVTGFHSQYEKAEYKDTPYCVPDQISLDGSACATLPDCCRPDEIEKIYNRREGKVSLKEFLGEEEH
jgi:uncharacterized protein (DUF362 family)